MNPDALPIYIVLGIFAVLFLVMIVLAVGVAVSVLVEKIRNRGKYHLSGISSIH